MCKRSTMCHSMHGVFLLLGINLTCKISKYRTYLTLMLALTVYMSTHNPGTCRMSRNTRHTLRSFMKLITLSSVSSPVQDSRTPLIKWSIRSVITARNSTIVIGSKRNLTLCGVTRVRVRSSRLKNTRQMMSIITRAGWEDSSVRGTKQII